jgi:hypothetical protein
MRPVPFLFGAVTLAATLTVAMPGVAEAQSAGQTGSLYGTVRDPSGAPVPGVSLSMQHVETGYQRRAETDEEGRYLVTGLPVGSYRIRAEHPGFDPAELAGVEVSVGASLEKNLVLTLSGPGTRVEVNEQQEAVEAASTSASVALGGERIEETPARSRNYLNFVALAPGLVSTPQGGVQRSMTVIRQPAADSGFSFLGLRGRNNSMEVDGLDNRDETTGGNRVAIGLEMVQEFRVAGAITGAELGGAAGGLINVVTRTGSNTMHGDVTFFVQNEAFNARRPETGSGPRPRFLRWQPGTSWYGPLRRDRTFLAAAIEAERETSEEWSDVGDEAARRIDAALRRFASLPLRAVTRGLYPTSERGEEVFAKLNHLLSASDTVALRYAFSRGRAFGDVQPFRHFMDRSAGGSSFTIDHSLAGNWFHIAGPSLVLDVRGQLALREQTLRPNSSGPMLEIPGIATFGQAYLLDGWRRERHSQAVAGADWMRGRHRVSAGGMVRHVGLEADWRERMHGLFVFPTLADFESGRPDVWSQAFGLSFFRLPTTQAGLWVQHRWQAGDALLLELGARADWQWFASPRIPDSGLQPSPRVGLSWRPLRNRPLVLRAGFGLFVDRYPLAWLFPAMQRDGRQGHELYATGAAAAQAFRMLLDGAPAALGGMAVSTCSVSRGAQPAIARKWTAGLEYGLSSDTRLTVQGAWTRAWRLPRKRNAALGLPPQYLLESDARSEFRGLSISLNRRFTGEFALLAGYDLGRVRDDGSDYDEGLADPANAAADWARSRLYQKHRVTASAMIDLPSPARRGLARRLFGDWNLTPTFVAGSGRPINFLLTTDAGRTGTYPISARPAGVGRNPFFMRGPVQLDARLMKTVYLMERRAKVQFGAESFNLLNRTNPATVSEYGMAGSARLASYGRLAESLPARQVQFFMQFEY